MKLDGGCRPYKRTHPPRKRGRVVFGCEQGCGGYSSDSVENSCRKRCTQSLILLMPTKIECIAREHMYNCGPYIHRHEKKRGTRFFQRNPRQKRGTIILATLYFESNSGFSFACFLSFTLFFWSLKTKRTAPCPRE